MWTESHKKKSHSAKWQPKASHTTMEWSLGNKWCFTMTKSKSWPNSSNFQIKILKNLSSLFLSGIFLVISSFFEFVASAIMSAIALWANFHYCWCVTLPCKAKRSCCKRWPGWLVTLAVISPTVDKGDKWVRWHSLKVIKYSWKSNFNWMKK